MICTKNMWKRLQNYGLKIKYFPHQCKDPLALNSYPNHSIHKCKANPIPRDQKAAQKLHNKTWVFWQKFQNWKLGSRAIQAKITIPLSCWDIKEGAWINTIAWNIKNWYIRVKLFTKISIIESWISCIFRVFSLLIYIEWLILKLTAYFNWVFVPN